MNKIFQQYCSPKSHKSLEIRGSSLTDGESEYDITNGIPNLIYPKILDEIDKKAQQFYEGRAAAYDEYLHLTFFTFNENESLIRSKMIDLLDLEKESKVLEVACGTGRDSILINMRLSPEAELHITDISLDMLSKAEVKLGKSNAQVYMCLSNALYLPYPDDYFDAFYSFGAIGEFSDISQFFKEVVRVCRPGAKVVVGDENLPVWLRGTEFGKILSNYNAQFLADVPFSALPIEARDVNCRWIIGGVFYLIDFTVGVGEPCANYDFEIPGPRGGTHRTRYEGNLEGVTQDAFRLAHEASRVSGLSMHQWLSNAVLAAAKKELNKN
ncbi:methyltransferase domain-containing protein [Gammaproteobacteria bacterium]|nr:methyltransferase domain-containing protein [Gammaproteobacteria bacterium]